MDNCQTQEYVLTFTFLCLLHKSKYRHPSSWGAGFRILLVTVTLYVHTRGGTQKSS